MTERRTAVRRAERCFAVARSTTFVGEREAAVQLGIGILTAAGLDPDDFDIPGRVRRVRQQAYRPSPVPPRAPPIDPMDAVRRFGEAVDRAASATGAAEHETIYAARRRNFDDAAADARQRDQQRAIRAAAQDAADVLWQAGIRCYLLDRKGTIWAVETDSGLYQAGDALLIEIGRIVVESGAEAVLGSLRAAA